MATVTEKITPNLASEHPMAGTEMTGAEMIIQVLVDQGVDTIFGYSGGAILPTYDAVFLHNGKQEREEDKINLVVPANEQGAAFMAAGYSRASNRVGVCLVTSGPGATNCVTSVRDSMSDSVPMICICGQVPRAAIGSDAFQEAPIYNIMSSCAKHVFLVQNEKELEATIRTAFRIATSGRPGPVVIDIPKDVQQWVGPFRGSGYVNFTGFETRLAKQMEARIDESLARKFFDMLEQSERPLIYAGGGVISSNASAELNQFMQTYEIPTVTTLMGIGGVDTKQDLAMHMLGMHGTAYANYAVEDCDFLIAVGSRFDDRVAGKVNDFAPNAKNIAHIDIDAAEIGKVKAVTWAFTGDAKHGLQDLLKWGKEFGYRKDLSAWHKHAHDLKVTHPLNYPRDRDHLQPQEVIEALNKITEGKAIVSTGVGQHQMWAAQYFDFVNPRTWLTSGSMGTMGFGLPAAIGAQLANPGAIVIDVDGDGSIRMNWGEMETMTTYNIPVKVLLLNNLGDGMVRQWQKLMYDFRFSGTDKSLHKKDFILAAQADGFEYAVRLSERAKMQETLEAFVKFEGPALLEVMIDPDAMVYPMVGPGKGYKEMIVGPDINPRIQAEPVQVSKTGDTAMF